MSRRGFRLTMEQALARGYIKPEEATRGPSRAWHENFKRAPKDERTYRGELFDSKSELARYQFLEMMVRAGRISNLQRQVGYPLECCGLGRKIQVKTPSGRTSVYTADFVYHLSGYGEVIEDWKGFNTRDGKMRIAVFEAFYDTRVFVNTRLKAMVTDPRPVKIRKKKP